MRLQRDPHEAFLCSAPPRIASMLEQMQTLHGVRVQGNRSTGPRQFLEIVQGHQEGTRQVLGRVLSRRPHVEEGALQRAAGPNRLPELRRGNEAETRMGSGIGFLGKNRCISHMYYCMVMFS